MLLVLYTLELLAHLRFEDGTGVCVRGGLTTEPEDTVKSPYRDTIR